MIPDRVSIVEVGPRDGLQNEALRLPADARAELIERLSDAGLCRIECGSFGSDRMVPQLKGTGEVLAAIRPDLPARLSVLTPNMKGLEAALASRVKEVAVLTAASEAFSRSNLHCDIEESLARASAIVSVARSHDIQVRGYISCALGCPFEGAVDRRCVATLAKTLHEFGCYEISLGDTIGAGTPVPARNLIECVAHEIPLQSIAAHFHNTYGQALANIFACLELGLATFDSSVAGLGGCPYAPGATGNVSTEDLVYMLHGAGVETGVELARLLDASAFICARIERAPQSDVARARGVTEHGWIDRPNAARAPSNAEMDLCQLYRQVD